MSATSHSINPQHNAAIIAFRELTDLPALALSKTFLERASAMIEFGVPVVPLPPCQKFPPPKGWKDFATTDIETIKGWLVANGRPAIAFEDSNCACVATLAGVWFLDIDNMKAVSEQIERETGHTLQEIITLVVRSSGEKRHLYFKQNDARRALGNVSYAGPDEVELFSVRANGEYVVSPLSVHPDTKAEYEITRNMDIIEAPIWLTDWLRTAKRSNRERKEQLAADDTAKIFEGGRDDFLFAEACKLRDTKMSQKAALAALLVVNMDRCSPPLAESIVKIKIKSAYTRDAREKKHTAETFVEPGMRPTSTPPTESASKAKAIEPVEYPQIGNDLISQLARVIISGTPLNYGHTREAIKVCIGALLPDTCGRFPTHENLFLRGWHFAISESEGFKTESFVRAIGGFSDALNDAGIRSSKLDGVGSTQFLAKMFVDCPKRLLYTTEGHKLATANENFPGVFAAMTDLYDQKVIETNSFKNKCYRCNQAEAQSIICITPLDFDRTFSGKGAIGGGGLGRWTMSFGSLTNFEGDWTPLHTEARSSIIHKILCRIQEAPACLTETSEARAVRYELQKEIKAIGTHHSLRLGEHYKRETALAAVCGDGVITEEIAKHAVEWIRYQIILRRMFWPIDGGDKVERMEIAIRDALKRMHPLSNKELKDEVHAYRVGSGGIETYNRAIRALVFGREIKSTSTTRKGEPIFCSFDCDQHECVASKVGNSS
jgi:hypothetical protein